MKKYITAGNIALLLLVTGVALQIIIIFFPNKKNNEKLDILKAQQKQSEQLIKQLQKTDDANRIRDSILLETFLQNFATRQQQLNQSKKTANENINHINSSAFTADSIRRAFANN